MSRNPWSRRRHRHGYFRPLLELLEARQLLASDFGDAPLPYPTRVAQNGAEHAAMFVTLGTNRDTEPDAVYTTVAEGDDHTGFVDDEDGVTFGTIRVGQLGARAIVNVGGGSAKLDAWIDFNRDGSWGGPGEQIADSVPVSPPVNTITFDVPSWAADGTTYARFRLSQAGDLGVGGFAPDGEVEDYAVTIRKPRAACGCFTPHTISSAADGANSVFAADVDSDGDADVLSANLSDSKIAWYENDGSQSFTAHTITPDAYSARSVYAADVDGDGDTDVLSASAGDDKIAWYENDGSQNFTAHTITTAADGAWSVFTADVDGDGDTDVLSASLSDDKIGWYENDGNQKFTAHTIGSGSGATDVYAADIDGDGDIDVVAAFFFGSKIDWYENDGNQNFTPHTISTAAIGANSVFAADVDDDGDTDVLSSSRHDDKVAWYENDGRQNFSPHTISTGGDGPYSVFTADLDGDGDTDVLSASFFDDEVTWYENDGSENFTAHNITTAANGAQWVSAADIDGDGDLDVLSVSVYDDRIAWYENLPAPGPGSSAPRRPTVDDILLATPHSLPLTTPALMRQRQFVTTDADMEVPSITVASQQAAGRIARVKLVKTRPPENSLAIGASLPDNLSLDSSLNGRLT